MEEINKVIDLKINDINDARELFGNNDQYLNLLEEILKTSITSRGEEVYVSGQKENVDLTETILRHLLRVIRSEERRVGKEYRCQWWWYENKKNKMRRTACREKEEK